MTSKDVFNGWKLEAMRYGGAVAVIAALTYLLNIIFAQRIGVDAKVLELWEKQTQVLIDIRTTLQEHQNHEKYVKAVLDTLQHKVHDVHTRITR